MSRSADAVGSVTPLDRLEARVEALLAERERLEREVERLRAEIGRAGRERQELKARLDAILADVDAVVLAVGGA
ncbi:MAG TPA: hypothetical protein VIM86_14440 [Thermodesulfobacteriota bacterium]